MKRISIRTKLTFLISLTIIVVAVILSGYFFMRSSMLLHDELKKRGASIAHNLAYTSKEGILTKNLFEELKPLVEAVMTEPDVVCVAIIDETGNVLAHSNSKEAGKVFADEFTKKTLSAKEVLYSKETKEIITFGAGVKVDEKEKTILEKAEELEIKKEGPIGAVIVKISLKNLHLRMNDIFKINLEILLGLLIIGIIFAFLFSTQMTNPIRSLVEVSHAISSGELEKRAAVETNDEIGELSISFNEMTENLIKAQGELKKLIYELTTGLSEHFEVLNKAASGDLSVKAPLTSENELVVKLGKVINHTIENLRLFVDEMTVRKELDQLFNTTASAIRVVDKEFNVIKANESFAKLIGSKKEDIIGVKCFDQFKTTLCHTEQCILKRILAGEQLIETEMEKITPEGRKIYCLFKAVPFHDAEGKIIGMMEDNRDITDLKKLETKIEDTATEMSKSVSQHLEVLDKISQGNLTTQATEDSNIELIAKLGKVINRTGKLINVRIADLEAVNKELESFTYSASHDLKEPLRGIEAFSQFLLEDYADKLDDTGKDYLKRLSASAVRMKSLIDDLLALSRISRVKNPYTTVDSGKLVKEVLKQLRPTIEEKNVRIEVDDELPFIFCDEVKIKQVFYNFILNAIKYNDKKCPEIEIGIEKKIVEGISQGVFFVKDNGIGIEEKYFEEIFGIFKRLHRGNEYGGGTGAGLAIVKRVITDHGGSVWVKSTPDKGSTFYFSLPRRGEKQDES
ncbi:PAS domain-containing protein [bacterium]|nr:PAS domain-containing protein [bacterium]MBU1753010.1 PAS domain-containing protein [bacterium]